MPLFTVIIPTFNRRALLARTLQSVWEQEHRDHEVIIVDDGSTDGTADDLAALAGRARVYTQPNRGPGAARQLALENATGEYAAFLDSDDLWFPWSLQTYAAVIEQQGRPSFIAGCPVRFQEEGELAGIRSGTIQGRLFPDYLASGDTWRWYGLSSFVVNCEQARKAGGFAREAINGEDADLALRLGEAPGFYQIESPVTYAYREHAGGVRHQLEKTVLGQIHQLEQEEQGRYPGDLARRRERWRLMSPHMRACAVACVKDGRADQGWSIYRRTFRWHVALGRWKFLAAFPALAAGSWLRGARRRTATDN